MKGTTQGKSGWYQDFDGQTYFFAVDTKGVWWQVMKPEQWQARSDELENVPVLVVAEGQKLGEPGKYREFGIKGVKKKPQKWKVNDVGVWKEVPSSPVVAPRRPSGIQHRPQLSSGSKSG